MLPTARNTNTNSRISVASNYNTASNLSIVSSGSTVRGLNSACNVNILSNVRW